MRDFSADGDRAARQGLLDRRRSRRWALDSVRKPVVDEARDDRVYAEVRALAGAYVMPA